MAIKEIQLSNIPKSEIGQIMVCALYTCGGMLDVDAARSPRLICSRT